VTGLVRAEPTRAEQAFVPVDDLDRRGQLVGIDPDDDLFHGAPASPRTGTGGEVGSATTSWADPS
jgi:hypothetical protein